MTFVLLLVPFLVLGLAVQFWLKRTVEAHSQETLSLTGKDVAERILFANGIQDVRVVGAQGFLSDHYDPSKKVIALSEGVFAKRSITAASIAAHEVGHAIQHAKSYAPLEIRSALFPLVAISSRAWIFVLIAGVLLQAAGLVWVAIALYAVSVLFHMVTLPVEFDASRRAKQQLLELNLLPPGEIKSSSAVLTAAASTYVVGALAALAQLVYLLASRN